MRVIGNAVFAKFLCQTKDEICVAHHHSVNNSEALDPYFVFKVLRKVIYLDLATFAVSEVRCSKTHALDRNTTLH
jgi:hypothetical protein